MLTWVVKPYVISVSPCVMHRFLAYNALVQCDSDKILVMLLSHVQSSSLQMNPHFNWNFYWNHHNLVNSKRHTKPKYVHQKVNQIGPLWPFGFNESRAFQKQCLISELLTSTPCYLSFFLSFNLKSIPGPKRSIWRLLPSWFEQNTPIV